MRSWLMNDSSICCGVECLEGQTRDDLAVGYQEMKSKLDVFRCYVKRWRLMDG